MAFLTPKVETGQSTGDNTPGRSATQSPREILPTVFGPGRVVVQWVTPVLRWHYRTTSKSQWAYFTCFGWICVGPVDEIVELIVNDKPYQGVFRSRDSTPGDYYDFTISKETPEHYRFFWGNTGAANYSAFLQSLVDPTIAPGMVGKTHPDYENIFAIAVQDMEAGQSLSGQTPPIPKVEVRFNRRSVSAYSFGACDHGTHPIGIVKDLLTLKRGGRGLPASMFNDVDWEAKMQRLMDSGIATMRGTDLFIACVLAEAKELSEIIADILSYIDGWLYERNGQLFVDWSPNDGSTLDETGLRVITVHELADDDVDEDPGDLESIPSQVVVSGLNIDANPALSEAQESWPVPFVGEMVGEPREPEQLNRPGFTTRAQLKSYAAMIAVMRSHPDSTYTVPVLRQYAYQLDNVTPLRAGDLFVLNLTINGGKNVVLRITERTSDDSVKVTFKCQREHGTFPQPAQPVLDPRVDPTIDPPADLARYTVVQLPPDLNNATDTVCAALVERPSQSAQSFDVEFASTNSFPGQIISTGNTRFAIAAVLRTTLASSFADVTITVDTVGTDWNYLRSMSVLEQGDDRLLIVHADEWFSIGTITALGGGSYTLGLKRARLNSLPAAHAIGAVLFIIPRDDIIYLQNADFANVEAGGTYDATTATKWFEIRPVGGNGLQGNWTPSFSLQLRDPRPAAIADLTARTGTGKIVELHWTAVTTSLIQEYHVYRATGPGYSDEAEIGQVDGTRFADIGVVIGGLYRYRIKAETTDEYISDWSNSVVASPGVVTGGEVDRTPPANPGALTLAGSGTYLTGDGTVQSYILFSVPVLPVGAEGQTIKRRRAGVPGAFETVGQTFNDAGAGVTTIRQEDLSPGTFYDFGLEAFSFSGVPSALILGTGSPYPAPGKTDLPTAPSAVTYIGGANSGFGRPATYAGGVLLASVRMNWTAPADKDVVGYEWTVTPFDTDVAADAGLHFPVLSPEAIYSTFIPSTLYFRVRSVDSSGNRSPWAGGGFMFTSLLGNPAGTLSQQNANNVRVSAVKTGDMSASSVTEVVAIFADTIVAYVGNGVDAFDYFTVSLANCGFSTKPTVGAIECEDPPLAMDCCYDVSNGSNSSTQAIIKVQSTDGVTPISNNPRRFGVKLTQKF